MRLQVQLVHAEAGVRVVLVSAWSGGECLGSALGEAGEAEEAERRAEQRLRQRLASDILPPVDGAPATSAVNADPASMIRHSAPPISGPDSFPGLASTHPTPLPAPVGEAARPSLARQSPASSGSDGPTTLSLFPGPSLEQPLTVGDGSFPAAASTPTSAPIAPEPSGEPNPDPEDWSDDLARIDLEVQRLGWNRSQEALYLERAYGHPSRSRLTRYGDLIAYLQALAALEAGADPVRVDLPLRRRDLLEQCDELLARLGWDPDQGRLFLELNFQCSSRQHLSDQQLLQFNMLLEEQWIQQAGAATA